MIKLSRNVWKIEDEAYAKHVKIPRFIISGGTATATNLGIIFLLTHFFHIWYLFSAVFAYLGAFFVSFTLQKFWTFRDHSKEGIHRQAGVFFLTLILGILLNTSMLYILVEYFYIHYLVSQIIAGLAIAFLNFFMYQKFIFRRSISPQQDS